MQETDISELALTDPNRDPLAHLEGKYKDRVAVCGLGYLGIVERRKFIAIFGMWMWEGYKIDGSPWCSRNPKFLQETDSQAVMSHLVLPQMMDM
jgi:hypothetical protein